MFNLYTLYIKVLWLGVLAFFYSCVSQSVPVASFWRITLQHVSLSLCEIMVCFVSDNAGDVSPAFVLVPHPCCSIPMSSGSKLIDLQCFKFYSELSGMLWS